MKRGQSEASLKKNLQEERKFSGKSQAAIEFMIFVGLAMILLVVYIGISNHYLNVLYNQEKIVTADDFLQTIVNELNVAGRVENDYSRTIDIPDKIGKYDYSLYIGDGINDKGLWGNAREIIIFSEGREYVKTLSVDAKDKCTTVTGGEAQCTNPGNIADTWGIKCKWSSNKCYTDINNPKEELVIEKANNVISWYKPK